jgi:hypothetical protein
MGMGGLPLVIVVLEWGRCVGVRVHGMFKTEIAEFLGKL